MKPEVVGVSQTHGGVKHESDEPSRVLGDRVSPNENQKFRENGKNQVKFQLDMEDTEDLENAPPSVRAAVLGKKNADLTEQGKEQGVREFDFEE